MKKYKKIILKVLSIVSVVTILCCAFALPASAAVGRVSFYGSFSGYTTRTGDPDGDNSDWDFTITTNNSKSVYLWQYIEYMDLTLNITGNGISPNAGILAGSVRFYFKWNPALIDLEYTGIKPSIVTAGYQGEGFNNYPLNLTVSTEETTIQGKKLLIFDLEFRVDLSQYFNNENNITSIDFDLKHSVSFKEVGDYGGWYEFICTDMSLAVLTGEDAVLYPPPNTDGYNDYASIETDVIQQSLNGQNQTKNLFTNFNTYLTPFISGLNVVGKAFTNFTNLPFINQLLYISLTLGCVTFVIGSALSIGGKFIGSSQTPKQPKQPKQKNGRSNK